MPLLRTLLNTYLRRVETKLCFLLKLAMMVNNMKDMALAEFLCTRLVCIVMLLLMMTSNNTTMLCYCWRRW